MLAKYGASKLDIVKQNAQDAALEEFEIRLQLKNKFIASSDKFTNFMHEVFSKTINSISSYTESLDSLVLFDDEYNSLWVLYNVITTEITNTEIQFNTVETHDDCISVSRKITNMILSIIDPWPDAITSCYSNFILSTLSRIFVGKVKDILVKYECSAQNMDIERLCETIIKSDDSFSNSNDFWFVSSSLVWNSLDSYLPLDQLYFHAENELSQKLTEWLFAKCKKDLMNQINDLREMIVTKLGTTILDKNRLVNLLGLSAADLEFSIMESQSDLIPGFSVSEGPHYFIPELAELQTYKPNDIEQYSDLSESSFENAFDLLASFQKDYTEDLKNECKWNYENSLFQTSLICDSIHEHTEFFIDNEDNNLTKNQEFCEMKPNLGSKLNADMNSFLSVKKCENKSVPGQKRRGRPRKIDEQNSLKNGQHKYSQENVCDCSNWIKDNFFEVAGNKPAIDRARLYELYTNYCLLKLCTPVDRALFGKIIRKVFPNLRSRRLIHNQVLKYHYVGLKPKFLELEQALARSDTSINAQEVVLSFAPSQV